MKERDLGGFMGMRLELDDFGKEALEAQVRGGSSCDAVMRTAVRYYLADRDDGRLAWRPPRFVHSGDRSAGAVTDVDLDEDTMEALETEARHHGMPANRLAEHVLLYFLADLDSGRAVIRLGEALEGEGGPELRRPW